MRESLLRFDFAPFDDEIERKLASMCLPPDRVIEAATSLLEQWGMSRADLRETTRLLEDLRDSAIVDAHGSYLAHAARVALAYARQLDRYDFSTVAVGLGHDLGTTGSPALLARVQSQLDAADQQALRILPTDDDRQLDGRSPQDYYDALIDAPGRLIVLKALDTLDVVLGSVIDEPDRRQFEDIQWYLLPRLRPRAARLEHYLSELCAYVQLPDVSERFRRTEGVSS